MDARQEQEWLTLRKTGIGGSDIAAICGYSVYRSPMDIFIDKVGMDEERPDTESKRAGRYLEAGIADLFTAQTGLPLVKPSAPGVFRHPVDPWRLATPDRLVQLNETEWAGLEIKLVGLPHAHDWGQTAEGIPNDALFQVHWYLGVFGVPIWFVMAQIGTASRIYEVRSSPDFEDELVARGRVFWFDHVIPRLPPPLDAGAATARYLALRYPQQLHADLLPASAEAEEWALRYREAEAQRAQAEGRKQEARHHLQELIGAHAGLTGKDWRIYWQRNAASAVTDWRAITQELGADEALIKQFTAMVPGARPFRAYFESKQKGD